MSGSIKTGSRKSALARLQSYHVVAALKRRHPGLQNEFFFKEASGDLDQSTPLWQMDSQGVFTNELSGLVEAGELDLAIHSHKDLETAARKKTEVYSVLPRADARDIILFKESFCAGDTPQNLKIFTSSPRRQFHLQKLLPRILPKSLRPRQLEFEVIRGNIQTRLQKFQESDGQALIMAKAALDRILATDFKESADEDFKTIREQIPTILKQCRFMVLPLSWNPCAPAQGAFACEFRVDDHITREMVQSINHRITEDSVWREREILGQYGGGCHQKIGVSHIPLGGRAVIFVRGQTDQGQDLDQVIIETEKPSGYDSKTAKASDWPPSDWQIPDTSNLFWDVQESPADRAIYDDQERKINRPDLICMVGIAEWFQAADQDEWICSTADSLGWAHAPDLSQLV